MNLPATNYAKTHDGLHIAYQVLGEGPIDLVYTHPWVSDIETQWEEPLAAAFLRGLTSFCRLITFDKRGTGLSDRVSDRHLPDLETRMDDVRAVMDATGSERAAIFGSMDAVQMAAVFAATFPERTLALIIYGGGARTAWAPDYPWGRSEEYFLDEQEHIEDGWATGYARWIIPFTEPSQVGNQAYLDRLARWFRRGASPGAALTLNRMWWETDVRHVLTAIGVLTLLLCRPDDGYQHVEESRWMEQQIPGSQLKELPGSDFIPWTSEVKPLLEEIDRFLATVREGDAELDRVLATVLFTDIVGSTEQAAGLGDRTWNELLGRHHGAIRGLLGRFRGKEVDTAGDGFFATFDGPARAVRCAQSISGALRNMGLEMRAGVHTGEIELDGDDVRGIAVHIGARVAALAGPSEVLVSSTVKDHLVAGSGLVFEDAGEHELKGVPDRWRLYRVVS
ncbi:MAG: adenylate/guanylate cyclase domain-containing protein [Actinomycetota bacterium]